MCIRDRGWGDRFAMLRLMRWLKKRNFRLPVADMTVTQLLAETQQTPKLTTLIWAPLCVAALNTPVHEASAQVFANVLRDSLAAGASASELLLPRTDLSELFPVPAARYLATRRGKLRTGNAIEAIRPVDGGFRLDGDPGSQPWPHVVLATAPYHAAPLLASTGACTRLAEQIEALDLMDALCNDPAFHLDMRFELGDMQFLNNYVVLHSRGDYEDWPEPERKRHLLRLWLRTPGFQRLPPSFADRNADMTAWQQQPRPPIYDVSEIASALSH